MFRTVASEVQEASAGWGDGTKPPAACEPFIEIADLGPERLGNSVQPGGGRTVDALLVLVRLLVGDADQVGQLLLRSGQA